MKFWEKKADSPLNIVVIGEYNVISRHYYDLFARKFGTNIFVFRWESMHKLPDTWTYPNFVHYVEDTVKNLDLQWNKTILVGHGIGGTITNLLASDIKPLGICLIAPIFHLNFINPFTSWIPSYKPSLRAVCMTMHKMYVYPEKFYGSIASWPMVKYYDYYIKNMMFFETIRAQISHYETLVNLKELEQNNYEHNLLVYGDHDGIISVKETGRMLKKQSFRFPWNAFLLQESSHCLLFELPDQFCDLLQKYISDWLKSGTKSDPEIYQTEFLPGKSELEH